MGEFFQIALPFWQRFLESTNESFNLYAPVKHDHFIDFELITHKEQIPDIIYNHPRPVTPLKVFFLPVKENVVKEIKGQKVNIILGAPSCDLSALGILDEFYLNEPYVDPYYKARRESTLLIGMDCFDTLENCHCTTYEINPYPENYADLSLASIGEYIYLEVRSEKGTKFLEEQKGKIPELHQASRELINDVRKKRKEIQQRLDQKNKKLPGYAETGDLISSAEDDIWNKYSRTCVACGGCATICPTCSCFLLVDRPGFEKIRQMDACQYPGFVRVAGGEDSFRNRAKRFRNRYMCKYVYKPAKFDSIACTGCGRCIDTCIGRISKNELFVELAESET